MTEVELGGHLDNPRLNPEHDTRVLTGPDDRVVGWGEVGPPGEPYVHAEGWMCVAPDASADPRTWDLLLDWTEEGAREATAAAKNSLRTYLTLSSLDRDDERREAYARHGLARVRAMH